MFKRSVTFESAGSAATLGASLVVDDAAGEADQDRGEGRVSFPAGDLPDGGGGGSASDIPGHLGGD